MLSHTSFGLLLSFICCLLAPSLSHSEGLPLLSLSLRARVTKGTVLGAQPPEEFQEYDLTANFGLPWEQLFHVRLGRGHAVDGERRNYAGSK